MLPVNPPKDRMDWLTAVAQAVTALFAVASAVLLVAVYDRQHRAEHGRVEIVIAEPDTETDNVAATIYNGGGTLDGVKITAALAKFQRLDGEGMEPKVFDLSSTPTLFYNERRAVSLAKRELRDNMEPHVDYILGIWLKTTDGKLDASAFEVRVVNKSGQTLTMRKHNAEEQITVNGVREELRKKPASIAPTTKAAQDEATRLAEAVIAVVRATSRKVD